MSRRIISLVLSFGLLFQQVGFAQVAAELNLANYLSRIGSNIVQDKFRPLHLRYFSYDNLNDNFKILLDKGDLKDLKAQELENSTKILLSYFLVGVTLPDEMFWVNLRPDSEDQIIDPLLEKTDVGKIMLEADLQLKKDTAAMTSPATPEGREYWDKLYKKAGELYGYDNITIPTLTRPWIVPGEIIVRESKDSAYVYKATLKVMLEQDYLKGSATYNFKDERAKELNDYSSQLIRELIIPKLTKEVNSSKRYAALRQVYYSLILSRWFKLRFTGKTGTYASLINTRNLTNLTSPEPWAKTTYFKQYQKSFADGEYNIKEPVYTPTGQVIRSYFSGGINVASSAINPQNGVIFPDDNVHKLGDVIGGKAVADPQNISLQPAVAASPVMSKVSAGLLAGLLLLQPGNIQSAPPQENKEYVDTITSQEAKDFRSILHLESLALGGDIAALNALVALASQGNSAAAIASLRKLADKGNTAAEMALKTLDITRIVQLASQGNRKAIISLVGLVREGRTEAKRVLQNLDITKTNLVQLASRGDWDANHSLRMLIFEGNIAALNALVTLASQGNSDVIKSLEILASEGNIAALNALVASVPDDFALLALESLAFNQGNIAALNALVALASQGNSAVIKALGHYAYFSGVPDYYQHLPGIGIPSVYGKGIPAASRALQTLDITKTNLVQSASQGNSDALNSLVTLADEGNAAAERALQTLDITKTNLVQSASQGNSDAAIASLRKLADAGNAAAKRALQTLDITRIVQLASQGNRAALNSLVTLADEGNAAAERALQALDFSKIAKIIGIDEVAFTNSIQSSSRILSLARLAREGNTEALKTLVVLASQVDLNVFLSSQVDSGAFGSLKKLAFAGDTAAINALVALVSQSKFDNHQKLLYRLASKGDTVAFNALVTLASQGNFAATSHLEQLAFYQSPAFNALVTLASQGNSAAMSRLAQLARYSSYGNTEAQRALQTLDISKTNLAQLASQRFMEARGGDIENCLKSLVRAGNTTALNALVALVSAHKKDLYPTSLRYMYPPNWDAILGLADLAREGNTAAERSLQDLHEGIIVAFQIERVGLNWIDFKRKMTVNGWASLYSPQAIIHLEANFYLKEAYLEKVKDAMSKVFGEDFQKILPILQQSLKPSSSPLETQDQSMRPGGIDFRSLPMTIQPMGSFSGLNFKLPQLSQAELERINVDSEIQQIRNMVRGGIIPSGERLKELIAACVQKGEINSYADGLLLCLIDILKLEEETASDSSPELKEALVIVDSQS